VRAAEGLDVAKADRAELGLCRGRVVASKVRHHPEAKDAPHPQGARHGRCHTAEVLQAPYDRTPIHPRPGNERRLLHERRADERASFPDEDEARDDPRGGPGDLGPFARLRGVTRRRDEEELVVRASVVVIEARGDRD
jgi:hypothetical protein